MRRDGAFFMHLCKPKNFPRQKASVYYLYLNDHKKRPPDGSSGLLMTKSKRVNIGLFVDHFKHFRAISAYIGWELSNQLAFFINDVLLKIPLHVGVFIMAVL